MSENNLEKLKKSVLFINLSDEYILRLFKNGDISTVDYPKGSLIHIEDELCDRIEIILSGNVVIDSIDEEGRYFTITDFRQGDILGGNLIFSSNPYYPMTITALKDTRVCQIRKNELLGLLGDHAEFLQGFLCLISDNVSILSSKIKSSINKTIREKIVTYLMKQQIKQKGDYIKLDMSKKKLSENMGVQRTSLSRELKKMKDEGLIDYNRDYIQILKL